MRTRYLFLALSLVVMASCGGGTASPTTTTARADTTTTIASSATTTSAPTTTTTVVPGIEWSLVADTESVFGGDGDQIMYAVAAGSSRLVAVGTDGPYPLTDGAAWTSEDGVSWSRAPHSSAFDSPDDGGMELSAVVAGGPGFVAVGWDNSGGDGDAAVWTSVDGESWTRVPHDETLFGGAGWQAMESVVAGGPGLVAVGYDEATGSEAFLRGAVWTSVDGVTWTRVPHEEVVFGGSDQVWISSITRGGPGLVAVGWDSADYYDGPVEAAVWVSTDGLVWTRVPSDPGEFGPDSEHSRAMSAVVAGGPGIVAVGSAGNTQYGDQFAAVWTSVDGETWTRIDLEASMFGGDTPDSIIQGGPGLIAFARYGGESSTLLWTSPDALSWTRIPDDEAAFGNGHIWSVANAGPRLVGVGVVINSTDTSADAAAWLSPPG